MPAHVSGSYTLLHSDVSNDTSGDVIQASSSSTLTLATSSLDLSTSTLQLLVLACHVRTSHDSIRYDQVHLDVVAGWKESMRGGVDVD